MKRLTAAVLLLLTVVLLSACGSAGEPYTVTKNGTDFIVNAQDGTVTDGTHIYHYDFSGNSRSYDLTITYPDGSNFWWSRSGAGGWSDDYDESAFVDGYTLSDVIVSQAPRPVNVGKIAAAILVIAASVLDVARPRLAWYLGYGWHFQNAEPSDAALTFCRIGGIIGIVVGIALLVS